MFEVVGTALELLGELVAGGVGTTLKELKESRWLSELSAEVSLIHELDRSLRFPAPLRPGPPLCGLPGFPVPIDFATYRYGFHFS